MPFSQQNTSLRSSKNLEDIKFLIPWFLTELEATALLICFLLEIENMEAINMLANKGGKHEHRSHMVEKSSRKNKL